MNIIYRRILCKRTLGTEVSPAALNFPGVFFPPGRVKKISLLHMKKNLHISTLSIYTHTFCIIYKNNNKKFEILPFVFFCRRVKFKRGNIP